MPSAKILSGKDCCSPATERAVYVSFDDGDHWQSLRLNMPATSVRDLIVKNDDLAVGTHGRGFWILDDITPLRQLTPQVTSAPAFLFKPEAGLPGALGHEYRYAAAARLSLPVKIRRTARSSTTTCNRQRQGRSHLRFATAPAKPCGAIPALILWKRLIPMLAIPAYWVRPQQRLSAAQGMHRFLWDMHYPPVPGIKPEYPIAAVPHNTAPQATSPWAMPGQYTIVLTANGKSYSQPLTVQMDPRVKTPTAGLAQQLKLSQQLYNHMLTVVPAANQLAAVRKQLADLQKQAKGDVLVAVNTLDQKLQTLAGAQARRPGPGNEPPSLGGMRTRLLTLFGVLQEVDDTPTAQATSAVAELEQALPPVMQQWQTVKSQDVPALNAQLKSANLPEIKLDANGVELDRR